jgi:hypothetical protein
MEGGQGDSIVLEEEIDPNYEPTEKEVLEYATWLGMDLEAERDLFWIAREGLKARGGSGRTWSVAMLTQRARSGLLAFDSAGSSSRELETVQDDGH